MYFLPFRVRNLGYIIFSLLVAVPIIEITVFIQLGGLIGLWPTIAVICITAAIGAALLRSQGLAVLYRAQDAMQRGEMLLAHVLDGLCLLLASALLLTPGFVTDGIGFLLFVPPLRALLWRSICVLINRHIHVPGRGGAKPDDGPCDGGGAIINGDFEDVTYDQNSTTNDPGGVERWIE